MPYMLDQIRLHARLPISVLALGLLADCGRDSAKINVAPSDVDADAPAVVTEKEARAFSAPADSVLTEEQVTAYLKTSLLQFDLIRKRSAFWHEKTLALEQREAQGGPLSQLRSLVSVGSATLQIGDVVGGSYVRSARMLGYNPAEMEWVRERMSEVGAYLTLQPMREQAALGAQQMREQAKQLRRRLGDGEAAGFTAADIDDMLTSADEVQRSDEEDVSRSVLANLAVLRRSRPVITNAMWGAVGIAGGSMGRAALSGLVDPSDVEAQKKLDEFRRLYEDALANRVSLGMEAAPDSDGSQ